MKFYTYFKTASYLLVFSAFLSLIFTGELESPYTIIAILGMAAGLAQERLDLSLFSRGIAIVSVPFLVVDFFFISQDILYAFTHLLILLTNARLLSLRTDKDYSQLYLLTFFDLLASSALTINLSFAFTFTLYLVTATWVLLLFHIKREVEERMLDGKRALEGTITIPFFMGIGGVAVVSLVFTLMIFFILPRVGIGLFSKRPQKILKTSGFTDKVDFGSIGPVALDPTVVIRVELPDFEKGMGGIYLRGAVLDIFNGVTWERQRPKLRPLERKGMDFFLSQSTNPLVRQEVILDPIDSRVIFGMPRLVLLSGRFQVLFTDSYDAVSLPVSPISRFQYTAHSDLTLPKAVDLDADRGPYPGEIVDAYTMTPPLSGRVRDLAVSITKGAKGPYQKAVAIDNYLKRNYSYTLDPKRDEALSPVEDFLFKNKEGYCDHFSTAMAVLLRLEGIPTRLVTGYVSSEWNDLGRFYTVRQRNAHSWVEVYFPSHGWIQFDPTPLAPFRKESAFMDAVSRYIGYVRLKWDRYIINFTLQDQVNAAKEVKRRSELGRDAFFKMLSSIRIKFGKIWAPTVILAVAIVFFYLLFSKSWKGGRRSASKRMGTVPFYQETLRILSKKGFFKPEGMTPREFTGYVIREKGEIYSGIIEVTDAFEKVKYGGAALGPRDMERINTILKGLKGK